MWLISKASLLAHWGPAPMGPSSALLTQQGTGPLCQGGWGSSYPASNTNSVPAVSPLGSLMDSPPRKLSWPRTSALKVAIFLGSYPKPNISWTLLYSMYFRNFCGCHLWLKELHHPPLLSMPAHFHDSIIWSALSKVLPETLTSANPLQ